MIRLKELREGHNIPQKEIASFLNIRQNTYSQYETGQRQIPLETLVLIARFYHVSVDYLLNLTDVDEPYPEKKQV